MPSPAWEWMIKTGNGPYHARGLFELPRCDEGPVWTFDRMGATRTEIPDGRVVCIGGEHEDFYDPDFCIYNDVVVFSPSGEFAIYGYPKEVFPPTDFHTATLIGRQIVLIGGLGYRGQRQTGRTPVYVLELSNFGISEIATSSDMPGWIYKHHTCVRDGGIALSGGTIFQERDGREQYRRNMEEYVLDSAQWAWRRTTNRHWRQFSIRKKDKGWFPAELLLKPAALLPQDLPQAAVSSPEWNTVQVTVAGVPVRVSAGVSAIEMIVEGDLPEASSLRIANEIRTIVESKADCPCVVEEV